METIWPDSREVREMLKTPNLSKRQGSVRNQIGMTLIEVLVAMVIMSIGLLGAMATQLYTLQNARVAENRSMATVLASSMVEKMRANRPHLQHYINPPRRHHLRRRNAPYGMVVAYNDVLEWQLDIKTNLRSGQGYISANGSRITVRIQWDEFDTVTRARKAVNYSVTTTL